MRRKCQKAEIWIVGVTDQKKCIDESLYIFIYINIDYSPEKNEAIGKNSWNFESGILSEISIEVFFIFEKEIWPFYYLGN